MRTHSTYTVATIVLEPKVQVGAPKNKLRSPASGYAISTSTALPPG